MTYDVDRFGYMYPSKKELLWPIFPRQFFYLCIPCCGVILYVIFSCFCFYSGQEKLYSVGTWLGHVGNICLAFLFFPVARGSSVLPIFGLTSEGCIKYHIWLGHMLMALFTAHGICYIIYWANTNQILEDN